MSHFSVLVIGEGVEEKLHPYEELHLSLDEWKTGEWHSPGRVGWCGASSDTPEEATKFAMSFRERFIDSLPDGTRITIVDCHI